MKYTVDAYEHAAFISEPTGHDVAYLGRLSPKEDGNGFASESPLDDDEWQRLINLVAAAPALLDELREAANVIRWAAQESSGRVRAEVVGGWVHHATKIEAAIAKAEGRAE